MIRPPPRHRRPPPSSGKLRWLRWSFAGLALLFILLLTLGSGSRQDIAAAESTRFWCLLCGTFGTADFLLNIALFVPLGMALRLLGIRTSVVFFLGLALSGVIEGIQLSMPARFSVAGDLAANSLGALLGAAAVGGGPLSLRRPATWKRQLTTVTAVGIVWLLTAAAFLPSLPRSTYYGQWTPELGQYGAYRGAVLSASIGGRPAPGHRLGWSDEARASILGGAPVAVTFTMGPPPDRLAPIFSLFDDHQREILLIGADGDDLVFNLRRRAADLELHGPALRWPDALAGTAPGDTLEVVAWREDGSRVCVALSGERRCHVPGVGSGWVLLLGQEREVSPRVDSLADLGWLAVTTAAALATAPGIVGVAAGSGALAAILFVAERLVLR